MNQPHSKDHRGNKRLCKQSIATFITLNNAIYILINKKKRVTKVFAPISVIRSCERDSLLLSPGQIDSSLADFGVIAAGQHIQILFQAANRDRVIVTLGVEFLAEQDVFLEGAVDDPRLLTNVGASTLPQNVSLRHFELSQSRQQQAGLAAAHVTADSD